MSMKGLPEFEYNFEIDVEGEETKERFKGSFVYARPCIRESSEIAKCKSRLDGGLTNLDSNVDTLHRALAKLRITLKEYPKWWEESDFGMNLYDFNIISEILKRINEFEESFVKKIEEKSVKKKVDEK